MAWLAAGRFSYRQLVLLAVGWAAGKLFIFDMCQWHLDWKLGMPMGEPFFSWFTLEAIARSSVPNLVFVTAFQILYLWRRKRRESTS